MASVKETDIPFVKRMRQTTRNIHSKSDALVNLKLGLTLADETVWSEGILTFANTHSTVHKQTHTHTHNHTNHFQHQLLNKC